MIAVLRFIGGVVLIAALGGCAIFDSIHWRFPGAGDSQVFTTDAKQRHLIITNDSAAPAGEKIRVCAEAAPDAFSAFSSSLGGGLDIGATGRKAEAAAAFAGTAATIERTQTVNLLRESMYRTCERWLSGALSKSEFLALAARDHRSMVAVLAIEQLTGVVKPASTAISGPATRALLAQTEVLVGLLNSYRTERAAAEKAEAEATGEFDAANVEITSADGSKARLCNLAAAPAGNEDAFAKCKPASDKVQSTKVAADATRTRENAVLKEIGKLSGGISSETDAGSFNAGGITTTYPRVSDAALIAMSQSIANIALNAGINEALMFCVGYLNKGVSSLASQTPNATDSARAPSVSTAAVQSQRPGQDTTKEMCNSVVQEGSRQDRTVQYESLRRSYPA